MLVIDMAHGPCRSASRSARTKLGANAAIVSNMGPQPLLMSGESKESLQTQIISYEKASTHFLCARNATVMISAL